MGRDRLGRFVRTLFRRSTWIQPEEEDVGLGKIELEGGDRPVEEVIAGCESLIDDRS